MCRDTPLTQRHNLFKCTASHDSKGISTLVDTDLDEFLATCKLCKQCRGDFTM